MSSELDVSPLMVVINGELSKLMCKFFSVVHEKHDIPIEDLKNAWEEVTGTEVKVEEPKKPKTRVAKKVAEEVATCIATIANGSRRNEICGVKVSEKSESGKYCNRHITWEKKEKKKAIEKKEEPKIKPKIEEEEPVEPAEVKEEEEQSDSKEPILESPPKLEEVKEEPKDIKEEEPKDTKEQEEPSDELKEVIRTALDIQRPITPPKVSAPIPVVPPEKKKVKTLKAKRNKNGNLILETEDREFVVDSYGKVKGKEDGTGKIIPLSTEDIDICKKKKLPLAK
jgi:hypothetical protein